MTPVTYLFVPATRPERLAKAFAAKAHAVIADLEDAVDAADKETARQTLGISLKDSVQKPWVRINAASTQWFADDVRFLRENAARLAGVVLSKTDSVGDLQALACDLPVIALIESARGLLALDGICGYEKLVRLAFGSADLSRDLGCEDDAEILSPARMQLVIHSASRGLLPPVDGVTFSLDDAAMAERDASAAARMGFGGKLCIHPSQLAPVLRGFSPSPSQVQWAGQVIEVAQAGSGAQRLGSQMIDQPVIARAKLILERHAALQPETSSFSK